MSFKGPDCAYYFLRCAVTLQDLGDLAGYNSSIIGSFAMNAALQAAYLQFRKFRFEKTLTAVA
jgi:hypothetical protein